MSILKFKRLIWLTIIISAITVLGMGAHAEWLADSTRIIAQSTTQAPAAEEPAASTKDQKAESSTAEKKEAENKSKTPRKSFRPSEQIEAEQAVDFPYDI
jgi:hypothetical protein